MKNVTVVAFALLVASCGEASMQRDKHLRDNIARANATNLTEKINSHPPASWRGRQYVKCGFFASYATQYEISAVLKKEPTNAEEASNFLNYFMAFANLIMDPICLRGYTRDGNLPSAVNLIGALSAQIPEGQKMSPNAEDYFRRGLARGATTEEMLPFIREGKFEELGRLMERAKIVQEKYPSAYVWPLQ